MVLNHSSQIVSHIILSFLRHIDSVSNDLDSNHTLIVFIWIQDALFEALVFCKRHLLTIEVAHVLSLQVLHQGPDVTQSLLLTNWVRLKPFLQISD